MGSGVLLSVGPCGVMGRRERRESSVDYLGHHVPQVLVTLHDKEMAGSHQAADWGQETWGGVTEHVWSL